MPALPPCPGPGTTYYFIYFLIYNLFKLDCLGNLPNLIIGIAPPFPLSDIAPTSGVEEADVGAGGKLLSLSWGQRGYSGGTESIAKDSASPVLPYSLHSPYPLTHL